MTKSFLDTPFSVILLQILACRVPTTFKWKMQLLGKKRIDDFL
ncbi:hypothetical protein [Sporosarcina sp. FSL K6-3457]